MKKLAVIGEKSDVYHFSSFGFDVFFENEKTAGERIKALAAEGYAVIYITEYLFEYCKKETELFRELPFPSIVPIPGAKGNKGAAKASLASAMLKAIGKNIG